MRNAKKFLVVLMAMTLITGCQKSSSGKEVTKKSMVEKETTVEPTVENETSEEPTPVEEELNYKDMDFSSLPAKKSPDCIPAVRANEKYALIDYAIPGMDSSINSVAVYSFEEKKVVGTKEFGETNNKYTICEDGFYVLDECKGTLDKYDFSCEQISSKKFTDEYAFSAYYSLELNKILYGDMNGKVNLYDVENETTVQVDMENQMQYSVGTVEGRIIVPFFDGSVMAVDKDGKALKISSEFNPSIANECTAAGLRGDYIVFLPLNGGPLNMALTNSPSEIINSASGKYIISMTQDEKDSVFMYNTIDMTCTTFEVGKKVLGTAVVKSGVVIVAVCDESGNITCELLFEAEGETKDIASDCYNQDKLDGVLDLPEVSGSDDMVKAINKMLDEYNIRLLYNSDTFNESMSMFEIEEDSEEAVLARVKDINLFL